MAHTVASEPVSIGVSLDSIRAAIDIVQRGIATRVVIHVAGAERLLPAARALAVKAGLDAHAVWSKDRNDCDIAIRKVPVADG